MAQEETAIHSFSGGELSPNMQGRSDLPVYHTGVSSARNFIVETQGGGRYRPGFRIMNHTRQNKIARLISFQVTNGDTVDLEFTDKALRFYKNNDVILVSTAFPVNVSNVSVGSTTLVVTFVGSHAFDVGDEMFFIDDAGVKTLSGVNPALEGRPFIVDSKTSTTITLADVDGVLVNPQSYEPSPVVLGSVPRMSNVYELETPYREEDDFWKLKVKQDGDTMYIVHPLYEIRKLVRVSDSDWTLERYSRTADPFLASTSITGFSPGFGNITVVAHGFVDDELIYMEDADGTLGSTLNSTPFRADVLSVDLVRFKTLDGDLVDLSTLTWTAGGYISSLKKMPTALDFYESRLFSNNGTSEPSKFVGSRSPQGSGGASPGSTRYDDYTLGTDDDHAIAFSIGGGQRTLWITGTDRSLLMGTTSSIVRVRGSTEEAAITPTSINAKDIDKVGVSDIEPTNQKNTVFYVQRGGVRIESIKFEALSDGFEPTDRNIVASHIPVSGIKEEAWQTSRPDVLWGVRNDGILVGQTTQPREAVLAWHSHSLTTGMSAKFLGVSSRPRAQATDQLNVVTERVVGGVVRRWVEFQADDPVMPVRDDFFTGVGNEVEDNARFFRAASDIQNRYVDVDSSLSYDGFAIGDSPLSIAATTGESVAFAFVTPVTGGVIFSSDMVGREIWKRSVDGVGEGRAVITSIVSTTSVLCRIVQDFDTADDMGIGDWALTRRVFYNFDDHKGAMLTVVTDGREHPDTVVSSTGTLSLNYETARMHAGFSYTGQLKTMPLEFGGETGPAQGKLKNANKIGIRLLNTLGVEVGTDPYAPEQVPLTKLPVMSGHGVPLFTGILEVPFSDNWGNDKTVFVRQSKPYPCTVQSMVIHGETDNS